MLHTLTAPAGLSGAVFTPPRAPNRPQEIPPEQFTLSADPRTLTWPAGPTTSNRYRPPAAGGQCSVARAPCAACPLPPRGAPRLPTTRGRTVFKSDYEADLRAARAKAQTPESEQVRREPAAIECKIAELVRRPGARPARSWGQPRLLRQHLRTGWVVNVKRLLRLRTEPQEPQAGTVRAAVAASGEEDPGPVAQARHRRRARRQPSRQARFGHPSPEPTPSSDTNPATDSPGYFIQDKTFSTVSVHDSAAGVGVPA